MYYFTKRCVFNRVYPVGSY